jgi:tRNA threonylcarbamoyladenosine biosynthesis protein TsaB
MNLLALDTSSRDASIAVLRDEDVLLEYNFTSRDSLSAMLIPGLEFVMKSLDMQIAQIDCLGITIGPGLFTGIRIGMATLKGLAFAENKKLVGVTSLMALAYKLADTESNIISLIDANKGEVYLGGYRFVGGEPVEIIPPRLLKINALAPLLEKFPDRIFTGSGAEKHADFLKQTFPASRRLHRSNFLASEIGRITLTRYRRQEYLTDLQGLLPFYLRQPDAETNLVQPAGAGD